MNKVLGFFSSVNEKAPTNSGNISDASDLFQAERNISSGTGNLESVNGLSQFSPTSIDKKDVSIESSILDNNVDTAEQIKHAEGSETIKERELLPDNFKDSNENEGLRDVGDVINEVELLDGVRDKLAGLLKNPSLSDAFRIKTVDIIANQQVKSFKNTLHERLAGMGVDKYKKSVAKAGKFIRNICVDYFNNTNKVLKFGLAFKQSEDKQEENVILRADAFVESVNLNNVVKRVNDKVDEANQHDKIDFNEYLNVVDMQAVDAMNELKNMRTALTPDVSRWFGAVQRIAGMPKEGEPFRNYLQRAMSMKSEIDKNLNHPERENIENALREVVPMLENAIFVARSNGKQLGGQKKEVVYRNVQSEAGELKVERVFKVDSEKQFGSKQMNDGEGSEVVAKLNVDNVDNVEGKEIENSMNLDEIIIAMNNDENTKAVEEINLSEYLEVVEMNAARAWRKLRELSPGFSFDVKKWLIVAQTTVGVPDETESLREYLQKTLSKEDEINSEFPSTGQENIKKVLKAIMPVLHKVVIFDRLGK